MKFWKVAGTALAVILALALSPEAAFAAGNSQSDSFNETWGSADVQMKIYDDKVHVEANNVRSKGGDCLKLKYKVDRRTTYIVPFDAPEIQKDSVGDLARTCDQYPSVSGEHDARLNGDAWVHHVSFEFCKIRRVKTDQCKTITMTP